VGRARAARPRPASGGYERLAYTPVEAELRAWFTAEARARHLDVHEDRAGNLWAWWGDPDAGRTSS
jgi:beta-ureidopropionase / N-carbamoyl-L-amino-acid hydrolase